MSLLNCGDYNLHKGLKEKMKIESINIKLKNCNILRISLDFADLYSIDKLLKQLLNNNAVIKCNKYKDGKLAKQRRLNYFNLKSILNGSNYAELNNNLELTFNTYHRPVLNIREDRGSLDNISFTVDGEEIDADTLKAIWSMTYTLDKNSNFKRFKVKNTHPYNDLEVEYMGIDNFMTSFMMIGAAA